MSMCGVWSLARTKTKKTVIKTVTRTNILQQTVTNILTVSRSIFVFFTVFFKFWFVYHLCIYADDILAILYIFYCDASGLCAILLLLLNKRNETDIETSPERTCGAVVVVDQESSVPHQLNTDGLVCLVSVEPVLHANP